MAEEQLLTEEAKRAYIAEFWDTMEPMIDKHVLRKRPRSSQVQVKNGVSEKRLGSKRLYTVKSGKKSVAFSIDVKPWLWQDGSVEVQIKLEESKNLVVPRRKIEKRTPRSAVWRPGASVYWFIDAFEPARNYLKALELTALDVGLFDNMEQAVKNLLG